MHRLFSVLLLKSNFLLLILSQKRELLMITCGNERPLSKNNVSSFFFIEDILLCMVKKLYVLADGMVRMTVYKLADTCSLRILRRVFGIEAGLWVE